jgi:hypothetical protein
MNLLREIQNEAIKSDSDILALLRKCRVLSSRIRNDDLKEWVGHELDGYTDKEKLPNYRKTFAISKGHFSGPFGSGMKNAEIPSTCIPKEYRDMVKNVYLMEGIGAYCDLLAGENSNGVFMVAWPAEIYPIVGTKIYERMNLMQAWQELGRGSIVNVIETVKTRILNFVLELESEFPDVEGSSRGDGVEKEKVQHIFNTYITGNVGNIASGSSHFSQDAEVNVTQGNIESLTEYLKSKGINAEDAEELNQALADESSPPKEGYGPKVSAWIGKMISKSASGAWKIGTDVAVPLITKAIGAYYGIGG